MDYWNILLDTLLELDLTPFKSWLDLNDLRNLFAIFGVVLAIVVANKKWGNKAVFRATLQHTINRPSGISNISIANLKDKPLVVYEVLVKFPKLKSFFSLHKFDPPLIIKGLEATSFKPEEYSSLSIEPNPFVEFNISMTVLLVTESSTVKCKAALPSEAIIHKKLKGWLHISKSKKKYNGKIYTDQAIYAVMHRVNGEAKTSFLLKSGIIYDEWPYRINAIPSESMASKKCIDEALNELAKELNIHLNVQDLA